MKQLQIIIAVLFVLKRYNLVKGNHMKQLQIMIAVLFVLKRYNHVKCTTYETVSDNNCCIICI